MFSDNKMKILETAFYQYLQTLSLRDRIQHLRECALQNGELYQQLAELFNDYNPVALSHIIEEMRQVETHMTERIIES